MKCSDCKIEVSPENWEMHLQVHLIEREAQQLEDESILVSRHIVEGRFKTLEEWK